MPKKEDLIADCSKLLWNYAKITFPKGAINCKKEKESPEDYSRRYYAQTLPYVTELDANDAVLAQRHYRVRIQGSAAERNAYMNSALAENENYRQEKIIFAKYLAEKYKAGVCGEIVRVLQDYAVNNPEAPELLKKYSYAHVQIAATDNRADIYHEILVIGLNDARLQALLNKEFDQCEGVVVLDYWNKDRYYVRQLPQKLEHFSKCFGHSIAKGLKENGYSLYCYWHSPAVAQPRVCEESETSAAASLQQAATFFNEAETTKGSAAPNKDQNLNFNV